MSSSYLNVTRSIGSADQIDSAIQFISQALQNDTSYADLSDQLGVFCYKEPTQSGLLEHDYPVLADERYGLEAVHEVGQVKRIPLPAELAERFAYMQTNCLMGLFPAIRRAWLSIDSDIFIWNYEDGSDVAYFDGLSETILSVGLVKPKQGIFQPHIVYLLCLTTPVDIVLLGVSFLQVSDTSVGHQYDEMHLLPEPLFTLPTDNVQMLTVESTDDGRIFMGGKDGSIYEIVYQAEDGWFSRKCRKINHSMSKLSYLIPSFLSLSEEDPLVQISIDHSRDLLYTRSQKGTVTAYNLQGQGMKRVGSSCWSTTASSAAYIARTVDRSNFEKLVHIAAISAAESSYIHLVAITHTGARLYFTVTEFGEPMSPTASVLRGGTLTLPTPAMVGFEPTCLSLVHVRLPPGYTVRATQRQPTDVHSAYYRQGVTLLLSTRSEDCDTLHVISSDNFPFQSLLSESHESLAVDGRSWSVAEIPESTTRQLSDAACYNNVRRPDPPTVVNQHLEMERKFVIVNSQGTYILTKLSPMQQLHELLVNFGADSPQVKAYFRLHQVQAAATCLVLMCSRSVTHQQVNELAMRAFFLNATEPEVTFTPANNTALPGHPGGPAASTPYQGVAPRHLSFQSPGTSVIVPPVSNQEILFSSKHRALCLYLARILRLLWETRMVKTLTVDKPLLTRYIVSQFTGEQLQWILHKLNNLRDFVNSNSMLTTSLDSSVNAMNRSVAQRASVVSSRLSELHHVDDQLQRQWRVDLEAEENKSLKQLQLLINVACEYLGMWKILADHQFHIITSRLTQEQQEMLCTMTLKQLLLSGRELCRSLIKHLIDMYITDSAATDAISEKLRGVCPSLYSCTDETYSKACEKLNAAKNTLNESEQQRLVNEALEYYKQVCDQVDLPTACNQLSSVRCYRGIVDLVLTAAPRRDPQNLALHFYHNGRPNTDLQGVQAYNLRLDCYKCITETLDYLLSCGQQQTPNVPRSPGPPPAQTDVGRLSSAQAEHYAEGVYNVALSSTDEMFHVALYDWLLCKNFSEKLLSIQSPYLESYLRQGASTLQDNVTLLDLLWKYHTKQGNFAAAARILAKLAEKQSSDLSLNDRIEYLARATMCARSVTSHISTPGDGDFLHELEDKMEVARLQLQIVVELRARDADTRVNEAISRLNFQLFDISTLYSDADEFDLPECKLAIVFCADHYDPGLIEALWRQIIDKEMCARTDRAACIKAVSLKLVSLGRLYAVSENYFPLVFLVKLIEEQNVKYDLVNIDRQYVFPALMEVDITLPRIVDVYDKLFKSKDPCWRSLGQPYHLLRVISAMLNEFASHPTVVPAHERRPMIVMSQDLVSQYLVLLQADTTADQQTRQVMAEFKSLQPRLDRLC